MLDVDAVVRDLAVINLVEAVDEIGDGRLSGARRAHKRDLLPRLGKQVEVREHAGARHVGKVHGVEAHVAGKRDQAARELGTVGSHRAARLINSGHVVQVPICAHALALGNLPRPRGVARLHQLHAALVHLGLKVHGGKQALGAGQRIEQEVAQLRKLVDGHGRLAHKDQVTCERTHVGEPLDAEHAARHRNDGVVGIADHHGHGHHGVGVGLRGATGTAQLLVAHVKASHVGPLVIKDLDDFLARDHLLDVSVQIAQRRLLSGKKALGTHARVASVQHNGHIAHERDNRELPVEDDEHGRGADHLDARLNHVGKAVVERLGDGVDVVGKEAHDVTRARAVEVAQRQHLDVREQVAANIGHHALGRAHHDLRVAQSREHARGVDGSGKDNLPSEQFLAARCQTVDDGAHHVGTGKARDGGNGGEHAHRQQRELGMPHVGEQAAERLRQIGGTGLSGCLRHGARLLPWLELIRWNQRKTGHLRRRRCPHPPQTPSARRKSPDKWHRPPAVPRACPRRGHDRRPTPQCNRHP